MWFLAIAPVSEVLRTGLTREFSNAGQLPRGDVIILLGGGADGRYLDLTGQRGILSEPMVVRTVTAARLYQRLPVPIIVAGGDPYHRGVTETGVAARYLAELGVPSDRIIQESNSRDTYENARMVKTICHRLGFKKPVLITSDYHLKRAVWCFERADLPVSPFANGLVTARDVSYAWQSFLPMSFESTASYLHEYIGLVYYRLID